MLFSFLNVKNVWSVKVHAHLFSSMLISHVSDGLILSMLLHTFVKFLSLFFNFFTFTYSHALECKVVRKVA